MQRLSNVFVKLVAAKSGTLQNYTVIRTAVTLSNTLTASAKNCESVEDILNSHRRITPANWDNRW